MIVPYKSIEELPVEIKKLPKPAQHMFLKAFNSSYSRYGEEIAFETAWTIVKKKFKKVDGKWVAKGFSNDIYTFNIEVKEDVFVQKADDGNFYIEGVLSDILPDLDGWSPTPELLQEWANQIKNM